MFEDQINILKNFNIYDIIARIAGLCLEPRNQNTSFILNGLIDEITESDGSSYSGTAIISDKRFRNVIESLPEIGQLRMAVDPPENTFTQNVMFYGNYTVFNGIDHEPAYELQLMLDSFCAHHNEYPKEFSDRISNLVRFILSISESIYRGVCNKAVFFDPSKDLYVPDGATIRNNVKQILFSGQNVRRLLNDDDLFWDMVLQFGHRKSVNQENLYIFSHPFLYNSNEDVLLVLDAGLLPQFLIYSCICLSEKAGIREKFISNFNNEAFYDAISSLKLLDHHVIDGYERFGIKNQVTNTYRDAVLSAGNVRVVYFSFLCDECDAYGPDTMHSTASLGFLTGGSNTRLDEIRNKISDFIGLDNVYHIICINSIGRGMVYAIENGENISNYEPLSLTPHELWCMAINEKGSSDFIPRYVRAKSLLKRDRIPSLFSELDKIGRYKINHYSFYFTDEAPIDEYFPILEPGDSVDYLIEAHNKADLHQVLGPTPDYMAKVFLDDPVRKIYYSEVFDDRVGQFVEVNDAVSLRSGIWLVGDTLNKDPKRVELVQTSLTFLSYWLGECRDCFKSFEPEKLPITIWIEVIGNEDDFLPFHEGNQNKDISEVVEISHFRDRDRSYYYLKWTPALKDFLIWSNNSHEKALIKYLIDFIISSEEKKVDINSVINNKFSDPLKRKMYFADVAHNPCNRPLNDFEDIHLVNEQDEEYIHDITGPALVKSGKWKVGKLNGDDCSAALNTAVEYLYNQLIKIVETIDSETIIKMAYHDVEAILYHILRLNDCYANEARCYPERNDKLFNEYNIENKTLASAKFLIEYVAACPSKGLKVLDTITYEYILAVCSTILMYAHQSDSFRYEIYDNNIEIFKSGRLGLNHDAIEKLTSLIGDQRKEEMEYYSSSDVESLHSSWTHRKELTNAFQAEFGYSDEDFVRVILTIVAFGEKEKNLEVHFWDKKTLTDKLVDSLKNEPSINRSTIDKIICDLSICQRPNFLKAPLGFEKWEVWPWRYDRRYSFTRRPIIKSEEKLIWGDRSLYRMLQYVFVSILDGSIHVKSRQFNDLLGVIGNDRGKQFNKIVAETIASMKIFEVYTNVEKISGEMIADEHNNTLGDIDVLAIDRQKHFILPIEVKSFKQARNPYEINREHMALFVGNEKKKSYVAKHLRRIQWCEKHLDLFEKQYNLDSTSQWKIKGLFVVNHPQVSKYAFHENLSILTRVNVKSYA